MNAILTCLLAAHGDDSFSTYLLCRQHNHKPDRAIADDYDSRAFAHTRRIGGILAGYRNIRRRQQTCDPIIHWQFGRRDCTDRQRRLRKSHEFAPDTGRLKARPAKWAGIIGDAEGSNNELAMSDIGNGADDLFDDRATHRLAGAARQG